MATASVTVTTPASATAMARASGLATEKGLTRARQALARRALARRAARRASGARPVSRRAARSAGKAKPRRRGGTRGKRRRRRARARRPRRPQRPRRRARRRRAFRCAERLGRCSPHTETPRSLAERGVFVSKRAHRTCSAHPRGRERRVSAARPRHAPPLGRFLALSGLRALLRALAFVLLAGRRRAPAPALLLDESSALLVGEIAIAHPASPYRGAGMPSSREGSEGTRRSCPLGRQRTTA